MDLNTSPEPEDSEHAVEISRQRIQRLKRPPRDDDGDQMKKQRRPHNKLPPGWLDCPAFGEEIGCLIPSKVPLGESFNHCIPLGKRYSSREAIQVLGRKLGLVIDLTNSTRYYSTSEWNREGIKHVKIACKGRDSVPENHAVNTFDYEVSLFLAAAEKCILVHCTHGHNRTGYMIVHFLMRTLPISVTQAIKIFSDARPPGIYKRDYIDALYNFYHEKQPEMLVCPPTPEWKGTSELDDDDDDRISKAPQQETQLEMTNDDILGDDVPRDQQAALQQFCCQSLKLSGWGRGAQKFPGSHPVSLNRDNLQLLRQRYYYATWKADGTRYMMLITMDGCYLIDRHFHFRRVQMRFPCKITNQGLSEKVHHFTLLDGEMVIDTVPDSNQKVRRYLIYDMMAINQISIVERPFYERWEMLEKEVIETRNIERQHILQSKNPNYRYEMEPFRVRRKDFWMLPTVEKILKGVIPKLSHAADGLIFQCWDDDYIPRTHEGLLKWKYPEMNSVDFLFEMVDNCQLMYLHQRGKKKLMEGNQVVFPHGSDPSTYSGKIIECSWDSGEDIWVCMRMRPDKGTPNELNTYMKVMRSIRDNITEDNLLNEIKEIICLPMYEDRIRSESKAHSTSRRR